MKKIKLLLFIASEKGFTALKKMLVQGKRECIGAVIVFAEINVSHSWDISIEQVCRGENIACFRWKDIKNNLIDVIVKNDITGACTISWKYIIPLEINTYLEHPLIVFHDSLLPHYRGFAPTPTAIICGETEIGVTAIFASEQVDQGDIVLQRSVHIPKDMYMKDIIAEQSRLCAEMIVSIVDQMQTGELKAYPQNEEEATYSIWRNVEDCHIDWSMSAQRIYDFVRAVGTPYPGAFSILEGERIKILKSEISKDDLNFVLREPGKIWRITDNIPEVICGSGMIRILSAVDECGKTVSFKRVRSKMI